jgi:hypothetical protein
LNSLISIVSSATRKEPHFHPPWWSPDGRRL